MAARWLPVTLARSHSDEGLAGGRREEIEPLEIVTPGLLVLRSISSLLTLPGRGLLFTPGPGFHPRADSHGRV